MPGTPKWTQSSDEGHRVHPHCLACHSFRLSHKLTSFPHTHQSTLGPTDAQKAQLLHRHTRLCPHKASHACLMS